MKRSLLLLTCGLLALSACGDDAEKSNNSANNTTNNNATNNNATNNNATNNNATNNNATNNNATNNNATNNNATNNNATNNNATNNNSTNNACDINGFTFDSAALDTDGVSAILQGVSSAAEPNDYLSLEFFAIGDNPSPLDAGPGTYPLAATTDDQNYQTCSTCALIGQNCTSAAGCATYFLASGGAIEVDAVDLASNTLKGKLVNATLKEVTVDFEGETYLSEDVPNGKTWCITETAFDTTPECVVDADCTDPAKATCSDNVCVACASSFDCTTAAAPACIEDATTGDPTCGVVAECTGDDANEEDDGPAGAKALASGASFAGGICEGTNGTESDWFAITITEASTINISVTTAADVDVDVYLGDGDGNLVDSAETDSAVETILTAITTPGTYYILVAPYDTQAVGAGLEAAPYTLTYTATAAECTTDGDCNGAAAFCDTNTLTCVECVDDTSCTNATAPVCLADNTCGSYDECTGDDGFEPNSDGPAGASEIVIPSTTPAAICGDGIIAAFEADWYTFTVAAPSDIRLTLAWTAADPANPDPDLDIAVFDSAFGFVDSAEVDFPEVLDLPGLAADTYYVQVISYDSSVGAAAQPYTVAIETYVP